MDLAFDPATDLATDRSLWFALALDVAMPLDVAIVMASFLIPYSFVEYSNVHRGNYC
jgi:hypothetical protein